MIPYFQFNTVFLGPVPIQVWGFFVSLGLLIAIWFAYGLARKYLLSGDVMLDISVWAVFGALFMARVFHVVFYEPQYYVNNLPDILKFWQGGASSLGGFVGALGAVYIFAKTRRFSLKEMWPYLDMAVLSLWLGWGIGRLGCFFIHDHQGKLSDFFLSVNFPSGARFDLGLVESVLGFLLFTIYYLLFRRLIKIRWGLVAVLSFMNYALVRFFLDFLRATDLPQSDIRYFSLTPAQWGMATVFCGLTFGLVYYMVKRERKFGGFA